MKDDSTAGKDDVLKKKLKSLPKGFQIASTDQRIAQIGNRLVGKKLVWDDEGETWKEATTGMFGVERMLIAGKRGEDRRYTMGAGEDDLWAHYYWDQHKQLW